MPNLKAVPGERNLAISEDGVYYCAYKAGGRKHRPSLKTKNLREAQLLRDELMGKPSPSRVTNRAVRCGDKWEEFEEAWEGSAATLKKYRGDWNNYCQHLHRLRIADVTAKDILKVRDNAIRDGKFSQRVTTSTGRVTKPGGELSQSALRSIYQVTLGAFFSWCVDEPQCYRADNPVSSIGKKNRIKVADIVRDEDDLYASVEEIEAMREVASAPRGSRENSELFADQAALIIELSPAVGARIGEWLGLTLPNWRRLAKPSGELHFEKQQALGYRAQDPESWYKSLKGAKGTIGDKQRVVGLSPRHNQLIADYVDKWTSRGYLQPGGPLFPTSRKVPRQKSSMSARVTAARKEAGIAKGLTHHSFRHTAGSRALDAGYTFVEIGELLGNSPEVARKRYAHRQDRLAVNTAHAALDISRG